MAVTNSERKNLKEMDNDALEVYYDDLTRAINSYQNHERDVWTEINQRRDPNFVENQKAVQIETKLHELRSERNRVISELSKQYDKNTLSKESAERVKDATRYMKELQGVVSGAVSTEITEKNSEIMTLRRLIINNKKTNENLKRRTTFVRYGIFFFLVSSVMAGIAITLRISMVTMILRYFILGTLLLTLFMIIKLAWFSRNIDAILVSEKNFKRPPSLDEVPVVPTKCPGLQETSSDMLVKQFLSGYLSNVASSKEETSAKDETPDEVTPDHNESLTEEMTAAKKDVF